MGYEARDNPTQDFTVTNHTENLTLDCNDADTSGSILRDIVGTLIVELKKKGIIRGTIT